MCLDAEVVLLLQTVGLVLGTRSDPRHFWWFRDLAPGSPVRYPRVGVRASESHSSANPAGRRSGSYAEIIGGFLNLVAFAIHYPHDDMRQMTHHCLKLRRGH